MPAALLAATTPSTGGLTAGQTDYFALGGDATLERSTEAHRLINWRAAGVISHLYVVVSANGTTGASTVTLRKNAADQALTLSIPAGATGTFSDVDHAVTFASGDTQSVKFVAGTGGVIAPAQIGALFTADANFVRPSILTMGSTGIAAASQTAYLAPEGRGNPAVTTEAQQQQMIRSPVDARNLQAYVSANARTTTTTIRTRKNSANGAQSLSIGSGATGLFEDVTNSDQLNSGDKFNYQYVTGTGTQTLTLQFVGCFLESGDAWQEWTTDSGAGMAYTDNNVTLFFLPMGSLGTAALTTETYTKIKARTPLKATNLRCYLSANARAVTQTMTLRKNGVDTAQTLSIGASATGLFENVSEIQTVEVGIDDDLSLGLATGIGVTSATIRFVGLTVRDPGARPFPRVWGLTGTASNERLKGLEWGTTMLHLSDGSCVALEHDPTDNTRYYLMHYGLDHATPTEINTLTMNQNSFAAMCRDDLDNIYVVYADAASDLTGIAYTKGAGWTWTEQTELVIAAGTFNEKADVVWCDTGGTNGAGILFWVDAGSARTIDAGILLAGAGTPGINVYNSPTFQGGGGSVLSGSMLSLAPNGFGAAEGICATHSEQVGHWAINSSGVLTTDVAIAATGDNTGNTNMPVFAIWISDNLFAVVMVDETTNTSYQIARYSLTANLTANTLVNPPTNMPSASGTNPPRWAAFKDPATPGRIWVMAADSALTSGNVRMWRFGVDVASGITVDSAATEDDPIPNVATRINGFRVVKQPIGPAVEWDVPQTITATHTALLKNWTDFDRPRKWEKPQRRRPPRRRNARARTLAV